MNAGYSNPKWHVLVGCFLSYMFDAMDLVVLAIAMPALRASLEISQSQAGWLVTATLLGIGLSSVVMGRVADTLGRRPALLIALISFGALTMAIAAATDWRQILVLRFLAGLGLGGVWSTISAHVNESWPAHQRGRATSFVLSSFAIGAALAAALSAVLLPTYGWRPLFLLCGALVGLAVVYVWLFVPESQTWLEQRQAPRAATRSRIAELCAPGLRRITLLGTLATALALCLYWGATTWIPTFLLNERGLDVSSMASFVAVMNLGMFVGYNVFGFIADRIGKKPTIILSLLGVSATLPMYALSEDPQVLLLLGPTLAFFMAYGGLVGSYFAEMYPVHLRVTGVGFCFNVGRGVSAFAPLVLGWSSGYFGFAASIAMCGVLSLLAALAIAMLPREPHRRTFRTTRAEPPN